MLAADKEVQHSNAPTNRPKRKVDFRQWLDQEAPKLLILPTVLIILGLAIYPLLLSAYLALSRFKLVRGGFELKYVGFRNFEKLISGSQQYHFVGTLGEILLWEWAIIGVVISAFCYWLWRYFSAGKATIIGTIGRLITVIVMSVLTILAFSVLNDTGRPGSLIVTLFYVFAGVSIQFAIALGLALLCAQNIRGKNFFRMAFFIPIMVTPVGIAYAFRMMMDMSQGPFSPIWHLLGLGDFAWAGDAWLARWVVLLGDSWQWIPFLFMVLLAAIENQPKEQIEAAQLDGASSWRVFKDITFPAIAPVAATAVLIRLIEAFKIIDLPNILTNGGPGIATESMTLHSFIAWRTQDLGGSAAVGYSLLFIAVVVCVSFFNFIGQRTAAKGV
jgi:multiple sugar transport system permease protein